ncbi:hypothetical protein CFB35_04795 [Burkholderia sp. AU16482]|nr:hypothetical protein CFB35_04795 [Burkholderia sp. AU16482]
MYEADAVTAVMGHHKANVGLTWHDARILLAARRYVPRRRRAAMPVCACQRCAPRIVGFMRRGIRAIRA